MKPIRHFFMVSILSAVYLTSGRSLDERVSQKLLSERSAKGSVLSQPSAVLERTARETETGTASVRQVWLSARRQDCQASEVCDEGKAWHRGEIEELEALKVLQESTRDSGTEAVRYKARIRRRIKALETMAMPAAEEFDDLDDALDSPKRRRKRSLRRLSDTYAAQYARTWRKIKALEAKSRLTDEEQRQLEELRNSPVMEKRELSTTRSAFMRRIQRRIKTLEFKYTLTQREELELEHLRGVLERLRNEPQPKDDPPQSHSDTPKATDKTRQEGTKAPSAKRTPTDAEQPEMDESEPPAARRRRGPAPYSDKPGAVRARSRRRAKELEAKPTRTDAEQRELDDLLKSRRPRGRPRTNAATPPAEPSAPTPDGAVAARARKPKRKQQTPAQKRRARIDELSSKPSRTTDEQRELDDLLASARPPGRPKQDPATLSTKPKAVAERKRRRMITLQAKDTRTAAEQRELDELLQARRPVGAPPKDPAVLSPSRSAVSKRTHRRIRALQAKPTRTPDEQRELSVLLRKTRSRGRPRLNPPLPPPSLADMQQAGEHGWENVQEGSAGGAQEDHPDSSSSSSSSSSDNNNNNNKMILHTTPPLPRVDADEKSYGWQQGVIGAALTRVGRAFTSSAPTTTTTPGGGGGNGIWQGIGRGGGGGVPLSRAATGFLK